jgi:hypothetical protein
MTFLLSLLLSLPTFASPVVSEADRIAVNSILNLENDGETFGRMMMILAAQEADLSEGALFLLASTHPQLTEMLVTERYQYAIRYLLHLPSHDRHRLRRGETILRTPDQMSKIERDAAQDLAEFMGHKAKKLRAIRIGAFKGFMISMEITSSLKRKEILKEYVHLAWPSTPIRDEKSREVLTKHFRARPSPPNIGPYAYIPVGDPSFEKQNTLGSVWQYTNGIQLITNNPVSDIDLDNGEIMDGEYALRFYASERTRYFPAISQVIQIPSGQKLQARIYVRSENLRSEFQQSPDSTRLSIQFFDEMGQPIGSPVFKVARLGSYEWELMEIKEWTPVNATTAEIKIISGLSGTVWFDGLSLCIIDGY